MRRFADLRDAVIADDPRFDGLRNGARISLSCAVVVAALALLHAGLSTIMLAASMAMVSSLAVKDELPRQQALTFAVMPFAAAPLFGLGVVVGDTWWLAGLIFAVVLAVTTGLARHGPRLTAVLTLGQIAFFFALFFKPHLKDLPGDAVALVVGVGVAGVMRVVVFRESAARTRRMNARALPSAVIIVLRRTSSLMRAPGRQRRRALLRAREDENAIALTLDGLDLELRGPVLDVEVAVARLVSDARGHLHAPEAERFAVADHLDRVVAGIRANSTVVDDAGLLGALMVVEHIAARPASPPPPTAPLPPHVVAGLHPDTRRALQVGLAAVVSLVAGWCVSPVRWPWALLTTSVVFVSGATRAETGLRGAERIAGTVSGVIVGVVLGHVVVDHPRLELALIFVLLFLSFAMIRVGYAWSVMWLTAVLSVLYRLTDQPVDTLLELRLAETVVGAVVGIVVSMAVLPSSTREHLRVVVGDLFRHLAAALAEGPRRHQALRDLDRAVVELRTRARPLTFTPRRVARRAVALVDAVDALAEALRPLTVVAPSTWTGAEREAVAALGARALLLADAVAHDVTDPAVIDVGALADALVLDATRLSSSSSATSRELERIDEALARVGRAIVGLGFVAVSGKT